ncbi:hypothetical protein INQ51_10235 [Maribellus sp. CM-23]|uniref:hypothetical protein n=1 Tax=Maribellus sp. CM-23 TaxID=2781026 RepID=UPI001F305816|nr:hypothetical protein [Maribellus sp. CM-23]MCE4564688.1 hypothetical protein [Maribellus sp. CM-23]
MKRLYILLVAVLIFSGCNKEDDSIKQDEIVIGDNSENMLKSGTIDCDWGFEYVDNFNGADVSNNYGLNDHLAYRQLYGPWKNTNWIRKEGTWYAKIIQPWFSQVNHPFNPNALSFHLEHSAVMLNKQIAAGPATRYRASFSTDPVKGDVSNSSWTSFMLDGNSSKKGYATETEFAFIIGSNGSVQVFQNGNSKSVNGIVTPAAEYKVVLDIMPNQLVATINGIQVTAVLDESLPAFAYVFLGAYIENQSGHVSWFDDLVINTQHSTTEGHVKHYGYYWASGAYGEHLSEVEDYTNFNFIASITSSTPNTRTHVLQARWQFWADSSGNLRPDWLTQWNLLLADINQNIDKIKALYVVDEPFWAVNVGLSDYNTVLNQIKSDLPNMPVIAVFAYPTVEDINDTRIAGINSSIDWVGADKYVAIDNFNQVVNMNNLLMNIRPDNDIFLIPQTHFEGTLSDAEVAEINWKFYNAALGNNKVRGLWNFGLWSHQQPSEVPLTLEVQKLIGKAIVLY